MTHRSNRREFLEGASALAGASIAFPAFASLPVEMGDNTFTGEYITVQEPKFAPKVLTTFSGAEQEVFYTSLTEGQIRSLLSNQKARISVEKSDFGAKFGTPIGSIAANKGDYVVTVDYGRYRDEDVTQGGKVVGRGRVGVGLRLVAKLKTLDNNVDISGPLAISLAFSAKKIQGSIETTVIGINNPRISSLIQISESISESAIQKAVESLGAMKVLVDAQDTASVPHLLAVGLIKNGPSADLISKSYS